jgi:D-3-phosphoglycerate dehydrogenase
MSARVNVVNASLIAEERGITVTSAYTRGAGGDLTPAITTRVVTINGEQIVSGALFGANGDGRITEINGFRIEAIPSGHMVVMRNRDVPGVIGQVGTILGAHGVNIGRFHLGRRQRGGEAMAVIETDAALDDATLEELRSFEQIVSARRIVLE